MATIVFKNAFMLMNGVQLQGALHELNVEYGAEMLDATVFGLNTRTNKGGLYTASISGQGFFDGAVGIEAVLWPKVGDDNEVFVVFPDGITEGSTTTGMGFAMKGVVETFDLGGPVGTLLNITWAVATQGIETSAP